MFADADNRRVEQTPEPTSSFSGTSEITGAIRDQLKVLEAIFSDPGLCELRGRHASHPAVQRYDRLQALERSGVGLTWPDEFDGVEAAAAQWLDVSTWVPEEPWVNFWSFLDTDTRRWTMEMLKNPKQFEDVMAELFSWGWLRQQGIDAHRANVEGESDIVIDPESDPSRCEVKRIHLGTVSSRISAVITKANKQIKKSDPKGAGTVLISVARSSHRVALDDRVPNDVVEYVHAASEALREGQNRSVAQAVVMWDDVLTLGAFPDPMLYAFRRRSRVVEHPAPRVAGKYSPAQFDVGKTVTVWVQWRGESPPPSAKPELEAIEADDITVTQLFRAENEFTDGIRARHAIEALREPDALQSFRLEDVEIFLATRKVAISSNSYILLILAYRLPGEASTMITGGFRLYREAADGTKLAENPLAAFNTLVERYGLEIRIGPHAGRFIPEVVAEPDQSIQGDHGGDLFLHAFTKPLEDGRAKHGWVFALDTGAYRAAMRAHQS